jgi:ribosomal protein L40E
VRSQLTVVLILALMVGFAIQPANAAVTQLIQHVFAKGIDKSGSSWKPINVTNIFTQEDGYIYAFTNAKFSQTNFTWVWLEPSGLLYQRDSNNWSCRGTCQFYNYLTIAGAAAVTKLGTWKMNLFADGKLLYSDTFELVAYVQEAYAYTFDLVAPMRAHVTLDATIHPYQGTWERFGPINIARNTQASNFTAYEYGTNMTLGVIHTIDSSQDHVEVVFDTPRGDGYRFVLVFDVAGNAFGTVGDNTFLNWNWNTGVNPIPMNVTVILPPDFTLMSVKGASDQKTGIRAGRTVVSFSGTAPPNGGFYWTVTYGPVAKTSIAVASSSSSASSMPSMNVYLVGLIGILIAGVLVTVLLLGKRRRGDSTPQVASIKPREVEKGRAYCIKCGVELPLDAQFCNKCGSAQN